MYVQSNMWSDCISLSFSSRRKFHFVHNSYSYVIFICCNWIFVVKYSVIRIWLINSPFNLSIAVSCNHCGCAQLQLNANNNIEMINNIPIIMKLNIFFFCVLFFEFTIFYFTFDRSIQIIHLHTENIVFFCRFALCIQWNLHVNRIVLFIWSFLSTGKKVRWWIICENFIQKKEIKK